MFSLKIDKSATQVSSGRHTSSSSTSSSVSYYSQHFNALLEVIYMATMEKTAILEVNEIIGELLILLT